MSDDATGSDDTDPGNPGAMTGALAEKTVFSIREFIFENFRLFTIIGTTGTMISLIPAMGSRTLGTSWLYEMDGVLPLILSIIILFGTVFLTICFFLLFSRILSGRTDEPVLRQYHTGSIHLWTRYAGDMERGLLCLTLIPMWAGITTFFIMLMPLIPGKFATHFWMSVFLVAIPLVLFLAAGWSLGTRYTRLGKGTGILPIIKTAVFAIIVAECCILALYAENFWIDTPTCLSPDISIHTDHQYYAPHISSDKGLRLEIRNISTGQLVNTRHAWYADYGFFTRVIPATREVSILGNPVLDEQEKDIYWTWSPNLLSYEEKPVHIRLQIYQLQNPEVLMERSLTLTWFDTDVVYVNTSMPGLQPV